MIEEDIQEAIELVRVSDFSYCHYITPNDVGSTGGHQCGFTFAKFCFPMFFSEPGMKGQNKDKFVEITWQNNFKTESRAIYYGQGTRNEYRITRFGRGFEFQNEDYIGSLMIMTRKEGEYRAYVLSSQGNIEEFMATFNLDITKGNQIINVNAAIQPDVKLEKDFEEFISSHNEFPDTSEMARFARESFCSAYGFTKHLICTKADKLILDWTEAEFQLFSGLEEKLYKPVYSKPFGNCQELLSFSNKILNRRKSRAGKSLEHHLAAIFMASNLKFEEQVVTENNKKPDFIFPDEESYHNFEFPAEKLTMLGAKTTCKDRWRQVLNEADRIDNKHLFTLQQGVSRNQLQEMKSEHLTLVVPKGNLNLFLPEFHDNIMTLSDFIGRIKEQQS